MIIIQTFALADEVRYISWIFRIILILPTIQHLPIILYRL
jgi:hypothetical protein